MQKPPEPFERIECLSSKRIELLQQVLSELRDRALKGTDASGGSLEFQKMGKIGDVQKAAHSFLQTRATSATEQGQINLRKRIQKKTGELLQFENSDGVNMESLVQVCFAMRQVVKTNDFDLLDLKSPAHIAEFFLIMQSHWQKHVVKNIVTVL